GGLGMERGFWRAQPEGRLEVLLAHPTGITEIYLGEVTGTKIEMATDVVARTASAKEVTAGHRLYGLVGPDLAYAYDMAAVGQPLQPHLSAQLKQTAAACPGRGPRGGAPAAGGRREAPRPARRTGKGEIGGKRRKIKPPGRPPRCRAPRPRSGACPPLGRAHRLAPRDARLATRG